MIFTGQVTQAAIDKLVALLNLSKDAYPTKAELEQPRRAIWHNKDLGIGATFGAEMAAAS